MLANLLTAVGVTLLLFILYRSIKGNPQAFSKVNLSRSMMTLGILALFLIVLIAFAVMALR